MAEDELPDLDFVIELPLFPEIEAELFVVLQHVTAVEHQLPQIITAERQRLEATELESVSDEYRYQAVRSWIDEFVEETVPLERLSKKVMQFIIHTRFSRVTSRTLILLNRFNGFPHRAIPNRIA